MTTRPPVPPRHECRDCAAPIVFARLDSGKAIPLDPMPNPRGNVACQLIAGRLHGHVLSETRPYPYGNLTDAVRMTPHAATCPERKGPAKAKPVPDAPLF